MISSILSTILSLMLVGLIVYLLFFHDETLIAVERIGLGLAGSAVLLSIVAIWAHGIITPYSQWYQPLWRCGWVLYLSGRVVRLRRHYANNERQKDIAASHFGRVDLHRRRK